MTLETAGRFLMDVRDRAIANGLALVEGRLKAGADQELARQASELPPDVREPLVSAIVDQVLVALLSRLDEQPGVQFVAGGRSTADESDGFAGELFGYRGWIRRTSRYPESV